VGWGGWGRQRDLFLENNGRLGGRRGMSRRLSRVEKGGGGGSIGRRGRGGGKEGEEKAG